MHPQLEKKRQEIAALCRSYRVRRLEVFGSAARARDFDPAYSDADFLVEFAPDSDMQTYFELQTRLAELLGRPVDLVDPSTVRNPYIRAGIDRSREVIYGA